ncbi:Response regulator receiver domain-containing protein [Filimonas lacunae]|uniref:Response regulator receiver domain-containing protein n=1 Tax=Filimonas lacunae TaxID=477680 RepID=A0A173MKA5_9BACT|nr:response regulator [Filimonas lacunae]BAV07906.1 two-component response regulator [Filimonas lacunae]SIT06329.1 Response regulator receiver domain-containing protein [Filimonas lacunae]
MNTATLTFLVDDDAAYLYGIRKLIEYHHLCDKVVPFENGQQAMDYIRTHMDDASMLPDYILLDLEMPVMDGWQFMEEFMLIEPLMARKVTVYIVSSSIDERDKQKAKSISAITDYLVKPMNTQSLREVFQFVEEG